MVSMFRETFTYLAAFFQSSFEFSRVPHYHVIVNKNTFFMFAVVMETKITTRKHAYQAPKEYACV